MRAAVPGGWCQAWPSFLRLVRRTRIASIQRFDLDECFQALERHSMHSSFSVAWTSVFSWSCCLKCKWPTSISILQWTHWSFATCPALVIDVSVALRQRGCSLNPAVYRQEIEAHHPDVFWDNLVDQNYGNCQPVQLHTCDVTSVKSSIWHTESCLGMRFGHGVISYCWVTAEHPDPETNQMRFVVSLMEDQRGYEDDSEIFVVGAMSGRYAKNFPSLVWADLCPFGCSTFMSLSRHPHGQWMVGSTMRSVDQMLIFTIHVCFILLLFCCCCCSSHCISYCLYAVSVAVVIARRFWSSSAEART